MSEKSEIIDACGFCNSPANKKCSACRQISYCSKEHQLDHWKTHKKFCKPFLVSNDETEKRILVATREIKCNEIILKEEPLVIGPKFISPNPVCLGCLKPILSISTASKCPKCYWPVCDLKCEGLENIHKLECDLLAAGKRKGKKSLKYEIITPIRCLLQKKYNQDKWNLIWSMQSHMEYRKEGTEVYREIQDLYEYLERNILRNLSEETVSEKDFHRICGILDVNGLDVGYDATEGNLSALYSTFSILEHCCVPNIKFTVNKFNVVARASKPILIDENLTISYTDMLWGTQIRQRHLLHTKYFTCSCIRCEDPSEMGTNFSSIKCLQDNCGDGYLMLENPLDANSSWKCNHCGTHMSSEDVDDIISRLSSEVEHVIEQKTPDIIGVQQLLQKLLTVLHGNHYNCFSIKHLLIQLYGHDKGYSYSQMNHELLNRKIEYCRELLYVLSRLDPTASRLTLYSAIAHYELSSAILEVMKRTLTETMNLPLIQDDGVQAKRLLTTAVSLLSNTKGNDTTLQLIYSCKRLYKMVEDVMQGQCTLVDT